MTLYYSPTRGMLDSEVHADIPFDAVVISDREREVLLAGEVSGKRIAVNEEGGCVLVDRDEAAVRAAALSALTYSVQAHLDGAARGAGYDSIYTAVSYADEPAVPRFQAEGQAFRAWRSLVWAAANAVRAEVEAGSRPIPSAEQLIAALPVLDLSATP